MSDSNENKSRKLYTKIFIMLQVYTKVQSFVLLFICVPILYYYLITFYRAELDEVLQTTPVSKLFHLSLITFLITNFAGNIVMNIATDKTVRKCAKFGKFRPNNNCNENSHNDENETKCSNEDESAQKPSRCDPDQLSYNFKDFYKFSRSMRFSNQRYYILFIIYWAMTNIYVTYCTFYYLSATYGPNLWSETLKRLKFFSLFVLGVSSDDITGDSYILLMILTSFLSIWAALLSVYHISNIVRGVNVTMSILSDSTDPTLRENIERVFGTKWYWAIIFPLASSPMPNTDDVAESYDNNVGRHFGNFVTSSNVDFKRPIKYLFTKEEYDYIDYVLKTQDSNILD